MTAAKLVILRHGETEYNKLRLMTGQRESPLTPTGEEQARTAGTLVKDIPFDKAYSSSLSRAFNTAALALKAAGQEIAVEKRHEIMESDAGEFAGRNLDTDPVLSKFTRTYGVPMPGGESDKMVVARAQKFFDADVLPRLARGENVLLVAHSGTIHALDVVLGLMKTPADDENLATKRIPNASPMVCEYEDGVLKKHYFIENPAATKAANLNKKSDADKNKYKR